MDATEIKAILNIQHTNHDNYFNTIAPLLIDYANGYCNQSYADDNLPGGVKIFVAKACEFNMTETGLKSRSMGEVSYSYDTDFPPAILKLLKPYRRVGFN